MGEDERTRIEDLVRTATLAFYDESTRAEMAASVDVDYITQAGSGHKVMIFAQSHEFEHERPVRAEMGDLVIDLDPEKVGLSSYHVHVELTERGDGEDGFVFGDQDLSG